jgi:hypothetical protein
MMQATRFPIDYDALNKGDTIPADRCEQILGIKQSVPRYALALLGLKERVEDELHERGKNWTLRTEKGALRVLTDAEASTYNHHESRRHRHALKRRFALGSAVDMANLTDDQRKEHERTLYTDGRYVQAMEDTRKQLRSEAHQRATPKQLGA